MLTSESKSPTSERLNRWKIALDYFLYKLDIEDFSSSKKRILIIIKTVKLINFFVVDFVNE